METMVESYSQRIFAGQRPVFDGRKNMYSKDPLPIGRDKVCVAFEDAATFFRCNVNSWESHVKEKTKIKKVNKMFQIIIGGKTKIQEPNEEASEHA